jgi:predicted AAA+ superfamily ATPase
VLQVGRETWAIEVKASRSVNVGDTKGLAVFEERAHRPARSIVVFLGARPQRVGGVEALPLRDFLRELPGL